MHLSFEIISSPGSIDSDIRAFIAENDNDFYPTITSRRELTDFVQSVYQAKGKYVICFDEGRIVGLTSVYLNHPSFITYYHYIAVDKQYRGKGISTTLYNYVHDICRENGVQWAIVKTWSTNKVSQTMFRKHGFFHLYTAEDDRSKGVHTYFFAKSFSEDFFKHPIRRVGIIGGGDNFSLGNFVKTISSIPRIRTQNYPSFSFIAINRPDHDTMPCLVDNDVSHCLVLDNFTPFLQDLTDKEPGIDIIDHAMITKKMVERRDKRFLLVSTNSINPYLDIRNLQIPRENEQAQINEIIEEIRMGKVSPAYYKNEIKAIAALNNCNGVLLGDPALHMMFGFDKVCNGIEIFDPLVELAIIMHDSRINYQAQSADSIHNSSHSV